MARVSRVGVGAAATSGVLAVGAALAVGHLAAGVLRVADASPFLAVGNAAIDRTPAPVKDFAIARFGTNDKAALLIGMAVMLVLAGAAIGLIARRAPSIGLAAVGVLGAVGGAAVYEQSSRRLGLLAPVAALLAGLAVLGWLLRRARVPGADEADGAASPLLRPFQRRRFLVGALGVAAGTAVTGAGGFALAGRSGVEASRRAIGALVPAVPAPPIPRGAAFPELGTPHFITPIADFYRIDINLAVPRLRAEDAVLAITGMVDRPMSFTFEEIRSMPLVEKTITLTCVSNPVGGPYVSTANFVGVPLITLLDQAGVQPGATQMVGHSVDGFTVGTPLQAIRDADGALLVIGMNREPLLPEHGFPMRTVVPGLYGYVSATKWVTELELATYDVKPYWVRRGWDGQPPGVAPIKLSSRIDAPGAFQKVPGADVTVAGTAWAQGRGIKRVEVRFDDGEWEPAELGVAVNPNTWRMFRLAKALTPGQHKVACRAVDAEDNMQAEERLGVITPGPTPDGATGWHSIVFTVV
ncbi:molybdopterin-dependent oxidoreductase [Mycolicibacterium elephantis]|uniref:molybdopterin-dependent oxidoreductase n=1 Tax=Mycolicibacterium elephantis TaxID=81858 RepID=UPI000FE1FB88|nr:molybdopterin-dependent oxidoreductase [Mycolicibacterium elephantis]MCV7222537.1 molybdopterin-dependent oxidoreductase [Mycolicibacterium elephantis]